MRYLIYALAALGLYVAVKCTYLLVVYMADAARNGIGKDEWP